MLIERAAQLINHLPEPRKVCTRSYNESIAGYMVRVAEANLMLEPAPGTPLVKRLEECERILNVEVA